MRRQAHVRASALGLALGLLTALLPMGSTVASRASEGGSETGIKAVGTLERMPADAIAAFGPGIVPPKFFEPYDTPERGYSSEAAVSGTLIAFPNIRRLWQLYSLGTNTGVVVRNLDTLRLERTFVYPALFMRATSTGLGGEWLHATDGTTRVFFADNSGGVIEVDLHTFASKVHPPGPPLVAGPVRAQNFRVGGLTYDEHDDSVLILIGGPGPSSAANTNTFLARRRLNGGPWEFRQVRSCNGPLPSAESNTTYGFSVLTSPEAVVVPCQRAGNAGAVVRLPRDSLMSPVGPEDATVGPVYIEAVLVDQAAQRLFMITILGEIWAYDARTRSFVGVVASYGDAASHVNVGYGIDEESGRVYFVSPSYGVGVVDGRFFPLPQARTLRTARAEGQERIVGDARTGRFFVLTGVDQDKGREYTVYSAGRPPTPPSLPDPDRNTADLDEAPGRTEAKYNASGSGYGVRVLLAKGVSAVAPAPTIGVVSPTAQAINDNVNSKCGYTDRELVAGRVAKAEYDTGSSAATASAVDVDERTKQDLERLSRCDVIVKSGNEVFRGIYSLSPDLPDEGRAWRYLPASCSAGHEGADVGEGDDQGEKSLGTSSVECPEPGGKLHAEAYADLTQGAVKVGNAFTVVEIAKEAGAGVVSTVRSVARDIDVAGVIHIAEVDSRAVSRAKGRPAKDGAPMSSYTTVINGVTIAGKRICDLHCDTATVLAALNQAAFGRAQFRAADGLDDRLRKGTPRGALTAVQKSVERQVSDRALVGDNTNEVPGLEMIVYNDNAKFGRARQVYQFAGVTTTANYNIVPLPSFADLLDDDDPGRPDGLALDVPTGDDGSGLAIGLDGLGSGETASSGSGGILGRVADAFRALARGFKLLVTDPRRAFLVLTAWAVLMVPPALNRRRRLLLEARSA